MKSKCYNRYIKLRGIIDMDRYLELNVPNILKDIIANIKLTDQDIENKITKKKKFIKDTGISSPVLSKYMNNKRKISKQHREKILSLYKIELKGKEFFSNFNIKHDTDWFKFRCGQELHNKIANEAKNDGISMNDTLLKIVNEYFDKKNKS